MNARFRTLLVGACGLQGGEGLEFWLPKVGTYPPCLPRLLPTKLLGPHVQHITI